MKKKKILAIIPARGGSKGIPKKNIKLLAGKPLIAYTCQAAKKSNLIDRVIVSTDDPKIAKVAKRYKVEIPFIRPANISRDSTPAIAVCNHALKWLEKNENYKPDAIIYLQPTSPLRTTKHINQAIITFQKNPEADTLVSVTPVPHNFQPIKLMKLKGKYLSAHIKNQGTKRLSRNKMPILYARNGPAILISETKNILANKLYGDKIAAFIMENSVDNIDIDEPKDLKLAEIFIKIR